MNAITPDEQSEKVYEDRSHGLVARYYRPIGRDGNPVPLQPHEAALQQHGINEWRELIEPTFTKPRS